MQKAFLLFFLMVALQASSQDYKDTSFLIRGSTCSCKYNIKAEDDRNIYLSGGYGVKSTAERPAYYAEDNNEWKKFLKKNLDKGFKGKDEVEIRFQVDKNGDLSHFELLSKSPAQKFQEIVRVLKLSGKWFPAVRNGFCISSSVRQVFEL